LLAAWSASAQNVIITEIMYNPPESGTDSLEYLEIHNFQPFPTDISGWSFTQGIAYTFPAGTVMAPGAYLVLAKSASAFKSVFGFEPDVVWSPNDALTNSGEDIEIRDASGNVVDYVDYKNTAPWPVEANGTGPSLVLCDFNSDNSLPASWKAATTGTGVIINNHEVKGNPKAPSGCTANVITANDDYLSVPSGKPALLNVKSNDLIVNALTLFIIVTPPSHGSATISGSDILYQSNSGYCGPDQFSYQICDANGCDEATVFITVKCYPQRSIGSVTGENPSSGVADSLNVSCQLQGTVYGVNLRPTSNNLPSLLFTIIDNSGDGIAVSSLGGNFGYTVKEGDNVTVQGVIGQFNGQTEIVPDTLWKVSSGNPLLTPVTVTALGENTESKLIRINNLVFVNPAEWTTGMGASGFNVRAVSPGSPLDTILIRIDRDVETYNAPLPSDPFDLIGIGGQFDATNPYTSGYQVLPRYNSDISTISSTKEADFSAFVKISPNPASDMLDIQMTTNFDRVSLLRLSGGIVKSYFKPGNQQKIDVSLLSAGTYLLRFEKGGKSWSTRFVKI
jgi:hypothetical protein